MTWLFEDRWTIILGTLFVALLLASAAWKSGRGLLLLATVGVVLAGGVLVLVEWLVVTDREKIYDVIDNVAAAVESNDVQRVLPYLSQAADSRSRRSGLAGEMSRWRFLEIDVGGKRRIKINYHTSPPTATAVFRAKAQTTEGPSPWLRIELEFRLEGDEWRISDYKRPTGAG